MNVSQKINIEIKKNETLHKILEELKFVFYDHKYAFWRAKKGNMTIIFYSNGTLLFQGDKKGIDEIISELQISSSKIFTDGQSESVDSMFDAYKDFDTGSITLLGLDESGKGDYFGPLILAGAIIKPGIFNVVKNLGVMDSKKLSDSSIQRIYQEFIGLVSYRARIINPEEYNELYFQHKNLNKLMLEEYIHLIREFNPDIYDKIILDRFSGSNEQNNKIKNSVNKEIIIIERGERFLAVAAASIIARKHFIDWIEHSEDNFGIKLIKGSGKEAGMLFSKLKTGDKQDLFKKVAKTHFKEPYG